MIHREVGTARNNCVVPALASGIRPLGVLSGFGWSFTVAGRNALDQEGLGMNRRTVVLGGAALAVAAGLAYVVGARAALASPAPAAPVGGPPLPRIDELSRALLDAKWPMPSTEIQSLVERKFGPLPVAFDDPWEPGRITLRELRDDGDLIMVLEVDRRDDSPPELEYHDLSHIRDWKKPA